jgi:conjugative transfer signal peptidase TraF
MSQPVLTATFALLIAVILTATIAIVASATETLSRAIKLTVVGASIALAVVGLQRADLRINFTGSMPIGIYLLSPLPPGAVKRGMIVAACAPSKAAEMGHQRGYLAAGSCADRTELLLKFVAATAGDEVDVTPAGVSVNSCRLDLSRSAARDRSGRKLTRWPGGHYRLSTGQVWLYAANDQSWDSRYWGPASDGDIVGEALPLLVFSVPLRSGPPAFLRRRRPSAYDPSGSVDVKAFLFAEVEPRTDTT